MKHIVICILITLSSVLYGQDTINDLRLIDLAAEKNLSIKTAILNADSAYLTYKKAMSETLPQLDFITDPSSLGSPLYSFKYSRNSFTGQEILTHIVGAGLSLRQQLPGAGSLSLSLKNRLDIASESGSEKWEYTQVPKASLSLNQPVLYNNTFIDFGIGKARIQLSYIGYEKAENNRKTLENSVIFTTFSLAGQVDGLRKNNAFLEESISVHVKDLEDLIIRKNQGSASETDVLLSKLSIGKKKEQLLESKYILQEAEQSLSLFLGLDVDASRIEFNLIYPDITFPGEQINTDGEIQDISEYVEELLGTNREIEFEWLRTREIDLAGRLAGIEYASSLSLFASLTPLYPANRDDVEVFSNSFSDFWNSGAFLDYSVGLSLTIPLYNGGKKEKQAVISENNLTTAKLKLDEVKKSAENTLKSLLLRREILQEQINQLTLNIEYENLILDNETDLYVLGGTTENELVRVKLDIIALRNNLLRAKSELFLNTLDITSLLGYELRPFLKERLNNL